MTVPNFFIIGAPKCGTTAIFRYLSTHPQVFMCNPKEPGFWAFDYPALKLKHSFPLKTVDDYLQLFRSAGPRHRVVGEASSAYVSSAEAVKRIIGFNPAAKLVVTLRNPVEFAPSYHYQKLFDLIEDEPDFETAWNLQARRANGECIPTTCFEANFLQYRAMGCFGTQVERLWNTADRKNVRIILLDDIIRDPARVYADLLEFLDLPHDGRTDFRKVNESKRHRVPWLGKLVVNRTASIYDPQRPTTALVRLARRTVRRMPGLRFSKRLLLRKRSRWPMPDETMHRELIEAFRPEINKLAGLLNRDLSHWLH